MIYMFFSNNPSSGDINSSNLPCYFKMYAGPVWLLFLHFLIYAQCGEDAAKRGGWRPCIK